MIQFASILSVQSLQNKWKLSNLKWHSKLCVSETTFGPGVNVEYCRSLRTCSIGRPSHSFCIEQSVNDGYRSFRVEITVQLVKPFPPIEGALSVLIKCMYEWLEHGRRNVDAQHSQYITLHNHGNTSM